MAVAALWRLPDDEEVEVGEGETGAQRRELELGDPAGSVAVVVHGTGGAVVDNAVAGVERGCADHELAARDTVPGQEIAREDVVVQPDRVVRDVEVGDDVDVERGTERRV